MKNYIIFLLATLTCACAPQPRNVVVSEHQPTIYPDYNGVTIPIGIAPLNFSVDSASYLYATVTGDNGYTITSDGESTDFCITDWHQLISENRGGQISITVTALHGNVWTQYAPITISVSQDSLPDYGLTYRLIAPGYETYSHIGIYQRCLANFDEEPILTSTAIPGQCMNCHSACRNDPNTFTMHVRGQYGGTLIQRNGQQTWLTTKTDSTIANCMYPNWHPSGNFCAYSVSRVHQCFYVGKERIIEVFDDASDATILDVRNNKLLLAPCLMTPDFETYPTFSADGKQLFYCTAKPHRMPAECNQMRYNICTVSFDESTGTVGTQVDTIINVSDKGQSATLPRPSYDGRFMIYCIADFGYFPIDHKEADLWIMNLKTHQTRQLTELNSTDTESFHNWSSNSRWIVFSSRRADGLYSLPYIAHIDTAGNATKPFVLPQRNPRHFYQQSLYSYNVPEFTLTPVALDVQQAQNEVFSGDRLQVETYK